MHHIGCPIVRGRTLLVDVFLIQVSIVQFTLGFLTVRLPMANRD
jgi:hypothetical protein